jgi:aldehyde dehydrogenase (NAD+)
MTKVRPVLCNYINGEWREGSGDELETRNPSRTKEILARGQEATPDEVSQAIEAADRAYDEWRLTPAPKREEYFYRLLVKLGDPEDLNNAVVNDLAKGVTAECGKTLNEGRADVVEGIHMLRLVAAQGRRAIGEVMPSEIPEKFAYTERLPRGVTAVISPWNFPFAIPWWMIGPALMMGNTVVFKPAEQTALIGQRIVELCEGVGFPPGVINMVHGKATTGKALVGDPRVRSVLFTGSYEVGREIKMVCAQDDELDKLAVLETGSKSGLIALDDADLSLAADATYKSAFKTTGQRCVTGSIVYVPRQKAQHFTDLLMQYIEEHVRAGDPFDSETFMGPLIDEQGVEKVAFYNDLVRKAASKRGGKGVSILMDGEMDTSEGNFAEPFVYVVDRYDPDLRTMREEVFGPHLAIVLVDDADEAIRCFESAPYSLAMSVITQSLRYYEIFRKMRHRGLCYVNLPTIGAEVQLPFGGTRRSGAGMPSAADMFNHVSHPVAVTVNTGSEIKMAQGLK